MKITLAAPFAFLLVACASTPTAPPIPAWTSGPTRTVDAGYIVYVGQGEDHDADKARFRAESMALQDLGNECSFIPKGARMEDHADLESGILHRAYAKVGISFQDCEAARAANSPQQIRTLANLAMSEQLKRYQDQVDEPEAEETQMAQTAAADLPTHAPPDIQSPSHFYVVRQNIFFVKQSVIFAPPTQYPPQAPQSMAPIPAVASATQATQTYAATHPEVQSAPQAFSAARPHATEHQATALRGTRAERQRIHNQYQRQPRYSRPVPARPGRGQPKPGGGGRGRHRRPKYSPEPTN